MGYWRIVVPRPDLYHPYNYIRNPSFEKNVTDGWTGVNTTPTQADAGVYGLHCCRFGTTGSDNYIKSGAVSIADDETVLVAAYIRDVSTPTDVNVRIYDTTNTAYRASAAASICASWTRKVCYWKNETGSAANVELRAGSWDTETSVVDVDACLLIIFNDDTAAADIIELTYFDGDEDGAHWTGQEHNSISRLARDTREHGQILDLDDDLGLLIETITGAGLPPYTNALNTWALIDGAYFSRARAEVRPLVLRSTVSGTTLANLYDRRRALIKALQPDRGRRNQPIRLFHLRPDLTEGDPTWRELRVRYDGGLELQKPRGYSDSFPLRLIATDPYFYSEKWERLALDVNDAVYYDNGGMRIDGAWTGFSNDNLTVASIYAILYSKAAGRIYIGGAFTNFHNIAAGDYIIAIDPVTNTAEALADGLNNNVYDMALGPDGELYVVGDFTASGATTLNGVAKWDGSSWTQLGPTTAPNGSINGLCFDETGTLYIAGEFTDLGGNGNCDGVAKHVSGTSWTNMGTGISGGTEPGKSIASDFNGNIYVVGTLTSAGGTTVYKIARWNGSAWAMVGNSDASSPGLSNTGRKIVYDGLGNFYIIGLFATADDEVVNGVTRYNGTAFYPVGPEGLGTSGTGWALHWDSEASELYVMGNFAFPNVNIAVWNGTSWRQLDMIQPNIFTGDFDTCDGNIFIAFDYDGSSSLGQSAGATVVDNTGTDRAYPVITVRASGGTKRQLWTLFNETTGAQLYFDLDLVDGEEIVIDLRPGRRRMVSSFAGERMRLLGQSALAEFFLVPGENLITCFVRQTGSPTVTSTIAWRPTYGSID